MRQSVSGAHATGQRRHHQQQQRRRRRRQFDDQQQSFDTMDNMNPQADGVANADPNAGLGNNVYSSVGDEMRKRKRR